MRPFQVSDLFCIFQRSLKAINSKGEEPWKYKNTFKTHENTRYRRWMMNDGPSEQVVNQSVQLYPRYKCNGLIKNKEATNTNGANFIFWRKCITCFLLLVSVVGLPPDRCLTCETITSREEAFIDLSIDVEPNAQEWTILCSHSTVRLVIWEFFLWDYFDIIALGSALCPLKLFLFLLNSTFTLKT